MLIVFPPNFVVETNNNLRVQFRTSFNLGKQFDCKGFIQKLHHVKHYDGKRKQKFH